MMKNNFYVTSYSTGIEHRCVATCLFREQSDPEYCNNSIQHTHAADVNMHNLMQGWLYINVDGIKPCIVFERDELNGWYACETEVAMQYCSTRE